MFFQNRCSQYIGNFIKLIFILFATLFLHTAFANALDNLDKIAEFNFVDIIRSNFAKTSIDDTDLKFKNNYFHFNLYKDDANNLAFKTLKFAEDYKSYEAIESKLDHLGLKNTSVDETDFNATDNNLYAHVFDENCHMYNTLNPEDDSAQNKDCASYLLKSTDGANWELAYTFTNEWKMVSLYSTSNNLFAEYSTKSTDNPKIHTNQLAYFDARTSTWNAVELPKADKGNNNLSQALVVDNKLIIKTYSFNLEYPFGTSDNIYIKDTADLSNPWVKINFPQNKTEIVEGKEVTLDLSYVADTYKVGNYYLAKVDYSKYLPSTGSVSHPYYLISKDHGLNWDFLNVNLKDLEVESFIEQNGKYHLLVSDHDSATDSDSSDSDEDTDYTDAEIANRIKQGLENSVVKHYNLTEEQFNSAVAIDLDPSFVYKNHAISGKNMNQYFLTMIYSNNDQVKFGFFKYKD